MAGMPVAGVMQQWCCFDEICHLDGFAALMDQMDNA